MTLKVSHGTIRETPARRKIRAAAAEHDLEIDLLQYEPIGGMFEMQGHTGGWFVSMKGGGVATGYNWREAVAAIHDLAPLWRDGRLRR